MEVKTVFCGDEEMEREAMKKMFKDGENYCHKCYKFLLTLSEETYIK
jgi:hypothetical protein